MVSPFGRVGKHSLRDGVEEKSRESKAERLDRELIELLNGLRVILPGVQVLFAFLLTVPFTQRFEAVTEAQRDVYFAAILCSAAAAALLIAPSSYHRLRWRQHDKERLLRTSNRLAIAGTVFLVVSVSCVVFVITDLLFDGSTAAAVTAVTAAVYCWLWFGVPLARRVQDGREPE
jgi:hypothetical protein